MNDEAAFRAALADNPDDKQLPLIFADWLEERGDPRAAWIRNAAVRAWMGPQLEDPIPALVEALARLKRVSEIRSALTVIGAPAVAALANLLRHENDRVRLQAIHCLRKIGPAAAEALPALLAALNDASHQVRQKAAKAVKEIGVTGEESDTRALRDALANDNCTVRYKAAEVLGSLGAKPAVAEELRGLLSHADATVLVPTALGAVAADNPKVLDRLLRLAAEKPPEEIYFALKPLLEWTRFPPDASPKLLDLLARLTDSHSRSCVLSLFGRLEIPTSPILAELRRALRDGNYDLAAGAAAALNRFGPAAAEAAPNLVAGLGRFPLLHGGAPALARLGPAGVAQLCELLDSDAAAALKKLDGMRK